MHREILTKEQIALLPLVKLFSKSFGLVGGTAVALHIGHRESIDFDLFSYDDFNNSSIKRKIEKIVSIDNTLVKKGGEYTFVIGGVKFTFFQYPYKIDYTERFDTLIRLPDLLTLAAMKIFALGRRAKWKDYVDMYFILRKFHSLEEINKKAREVFGKEYNEKIVRSQLSYFDDVNYAEKVIYKKGFSVDDATVKKFLIEKSIEL